MSEASSKSIDGASLALGGGRPSEIEEPLDRALMTGLPVFNEFQRILGYVVDGRQGIETVESPLGLLDREFTALSESFRVELSYLDWTPVEQLHVPEVMDCLERTQRYLVLLQTAFRQGSLSDLRRWTDLARVQIQRLMDKFQILAEDVKARPQFSKSAFVHEIVRCGHLFLAEKLSVELFLDKVHGLQAHLKLFLSQLDATVPDPREANVFAECREKLNESVETIFHTVEDLEIEAVKSGEELDIESIEACLDALAQEADQVFNIAQSLHQSMASEVKRACFRCGADNVEGARSCHQCRALLAIASDPPVSSTVDLRLVDGGVQQSGQSELPETYRKLVELLEGAVDGRVKSDVLNPAFEAVRNNLNAVDRMMDRLNTVPDFKTEDEENLYWEFRETLELAIERTRECLDSADQAIARKDFSGLYACIVELRSMGTDVGRAMQKGTSWMRASQAS